MLPMGTIMAVSMLLAVLINTDIAVLKKIQTLPNILLKCLAWWVMLSGLWNVLWYASQHIGEFWGNAALISGLLMIIAALYRLLPQQLPVLILSIKPAVLFLLLACCSLYSLTIYNL